MEYFEIAAYAVLLVLNVLFGWLCMNWMRRKGYEDIAWLGLVMSLLTGFVVALLVVSFLPGRRQRVARRPLHRPMPRARMPQARPAVPYGSMPPQPSDAR